jgi:nucleoid DNA-binding protein
MALTKSQIVESIQNQTGFPKNKSSEIVETLFDSKLFEQQRL